MCAAQDVDKVNRLPDAEKPCKTRKRGLQMRAHTITRTGDFAKQSSGSAGAALESIGFDRRQSAKSRPANQWVCRLRESFGFQRGLVAPAGRCSGATASTYVTDFAARVDEVSRNFNFARSRSGNFCGCGVCQRSEPPLIERRRYL